MFIDFHWFSLVLSIWRRLVGHLAPGEARRGGAIVWRVSPNGPFRSLEAFWGYLGPTWPHLTPPPGAVQKSRYPPREVLDASWRGQKEMSWGQEAQNPFKNQCFSMFSNLQTRLNNSNKNVTWQQNMNPIWVCVLWIIQVLFKRSLENSKKH